jgi:hypothetical protein
VTREVGWCCGVNLVAFQRVVLEIETVVRGGGGYWVERGVKNDDDTAVSCGVITREVGSCCGEHLTRIRGAVVEIEGMVRG